MAKISRKNSIVTTDSISADLGCENTLESVLYALEGTRKDYHQAVRISSVDLDSGAPLKEQAKAEINRLGFDGITAMERWITAQKEQTNKVAAPVVTLEPEPAAEFVDSRLSSEGITVFVTPDSLEEEAPVTATVKMAVCRYCGMNVKAKNLGNHEKDCAKNPKSAAYKRIEADNTRKAHHEAELRRKASQAEAEKQIKEQESVVVEPKVEETVNQAELMAQMELEEAERKAFEARMKAEAEAKRLEEAAEIAKKTQEMAEMTSFDDLLAQISAIKEENENKVETAKTEGLAWKTEHDAICKERDDAKDAILKMQTAVDLNKKMAEKTPGLVRQIPETLINAVLAKGENIAARFALIDADSRKASYQATLVLIEDKGKGKGKSGNKPADKPADAELKPGLSNKVYDLASFKKAFDGWITFNRRDGSVLNGGALYCVSKTLMQRMEYGPVSDEDLKELASQTGTDVLEQLGVNMSKNTALLSAIVESQIRYAKRILGGSENK